MHGLSYLKRAPWFPALFAVAVISSAAAPHNRLDQRGLRALDYPEGLMSRLWFPDRCQRA